MTGVVAGHVVDITLPLADAPTATDLSPGALRGRINRPWTEAETREADGSRARGPFSSCADSIIGGYRYRFPV